MKRAAIAFAALFVGIALGAILASLTAQEPDGPDCSIEAQLEVADRFGVDRYLAYSDACAFDKVTRGGR